MSLWVMCHLSGKQRHWIGEWKQKTNFYLVKKIQHPVCLRRSCMDSTLSTSNCCSVWTRPCVCVCSSWRVCALLINIQPEDRVPRLDPVAGDQQCGDDQWRVHVVSWVLAINFWSTFDTAPCRTSSLFSLLLLCLFNTSHFTSFFSSPTKSA